MMDTSRTCGIYAIVNNVIGRIYLGHVGSTFDRRWSHHRDSLNRGKHHNKELQRDWTQLGASAFEFVVIESFPMNIADIYALRALERRYIVTSECWLYNATKDQYRGKSDEYLISRLYQ